MTIINHAKTVTKDMYENERDFVKTIVENSISSDNLLKSIGFDVNADYDVDMDTYTTEVETRIDTKRIDAVYRDEDQQPFLGVECMSLGKNLDPDHCWRVPFYLHGLGISECILLTEMIDMDSESVKFIRHLNDDHRYKIWIVKYTIFKIDGGQIIDFECVLSPQKPKQKADSRQSIAPVYSNDTLQPLTSDDTGVINYFANHVSRWVKDSDGLFVGGGKASKSGYRGVNWDGTIRIGLDKSNEPYTNSAAGNIRGIRTSEKYPDIITAARKVADIYSSPENYVKFINEIHGL